MGPKQEDHTVIRINFVMKCCVSGIYITLVECFLVWKHSRHVGKRIGGFESIHNGYELDKRNVEGRRLLELCDEKKLCVVNTLLEKRAEKNNIQFVWK